MHHLLPLGFVGQKLLRGGQSGTFSLGSQESKTPLSPKDPSFFKS